ncbi:hypothetical protein MMC29_008393 [Sticta canariensis]|nr:hypothetical protein [Sticta canariensis]
MESQNPEAWEAYASSFSLAEYDFVPTNQLLQQPLRQDEPEQTGNEDPEISSGEEAEFAMETNTESGGIAEEATEDLDEDEIERVTHPVTSHGLPVLPNDFQPLRGENHSRSWTLPSGFGTDPRVRPPRGCTDTCTHAGHGDNCASTATDPGISTEDRWDLPFLLFDRFFTKEILEVMVSNTNQYAASKNTGIPGAGQ